MYRVSGLVVLVIGGLLASALIFGSFDTEARRWTRDESGSRVKARVECPGPYAIFFEDAVNDSISGYEHERYCVRTARRLFVIGALVAISALALGVRGLIRGPRPPLRHLRPLSEVLEERGPPAGVTL